jgi:transcriptional antiterminator NusG
MSRRYWTEDKIISEIQKLHDQGDDLWYRAMERNHKDLIRASERYFKGWKNAVIAAGLDYNAIKKRSHQVWSKEKILAQLMNLQQPGEVFRSSTVQKRDKKLYHAAIRQFDNFNNAIKELNEKYGLSIETRPTRKYGKTQLRESKKEPKLVHKKEQKDKPDKEMKIFTVRTRIRSERNVGESIVKRAKNDGLTLGMIQYPAILNGYIFVECDDREALNRIIKNIKNAQGLLNGETTHNEITNYLGPSKSRRALIEGTKVEIIEGQFKGERAVIQHVNERTKEVTVELMDEVFKIPIVLSRNHCKIL